MSSVEIPSEISFINSDKYAMKPQTIPVKRLSAQKGIFKRLRAVTGNRKQRVAAAATTPSEMEEEDGSSKISRALTIIFLIHSVAIGLIFIHQRFLDGRSPEESKTAKSGNEEAAATVASVPSRLDLPRMTTGEKPYIVRQGDNYARIASALGVQESDLRLINKHADIVPGLLLKVPPKRIVAVEPPEVSAIREQAPVDSAAGLVEAVPVNVSGAPRAQLVRPSVTPVTETPRVTKSAIKSTSEPVALSGKTYVTKDGDSIWRIANKYKVNQDALMKANNITDPRKIRSGMNLVIPR